MQSTPGEIGVRLWCQEVLRVKNWINPLECQEWQLSKVATNRIDEQWTFRNREEDRNAAIQQLKRAGIDISKKKFRPTDLPPEMQILIALGRLKARYGKHFRTIATPHDGYRIQLEHNKIANRLKDRNKRRWQQWIDTGVLCL